MMRFVWLIMVVVLAGCGNAGAAATPVIPVSGVTPEQFGAKGNGTVNDRAAFKSAFLVACTGIPLVLKPNANYDLGTAVDQAGVDNFLLSYVNAKLNVIGNGATITTHTAAPGQPYVFKLTNPWYAKFNDVNFVNPGSDISVVAHQGVHHIRVISEGSVSQYGNIELHNVTATGGTTPLSVWGAPGVAARIQNISFTGNDVFDTTFYGPCFQQNGDNVTGGWTSKNNRRSYFPYGVKNHNLDLKIYHDSATTGSTGDIEIASIRDAGQLYTDTRAIRARISFYGTQFGGNPVLFQTQSDDGLAVIDDVHLDLSYGTLPWVGQTVQFSSFSMAGVLKATTFDIWNDIRLTGDFIRGGGVVESIYAESAQVTKGGLTIDTPLLTSAAPDIAGFKTIYTDMNVLTTSTPWTPVDASTDALTFAAVEGAYTKSGKWVTAYFSLTWPTCPSATGPVKLGGLPFPVKATSINAQGGYLTLNSSGMVLIPVAGTETSDIWLFKLDGTAPANSELSGKQIRGVVIYEVD